MTRHHTCRFCGKIEFGEDRGVQYGRRHWAHHSCYLDHKALHALHPWQVQTFPFKLLRERGLLAEAEACSAR